MIAATNNPGKLREIREILGGHIKSLSDVNIVSDPEENGGTLAENAFIKANAVYEKKQEPVFADDSGLFIKSLNFEPGVNSARYEEPGHRREKVLRLLENVTDRTAVFMTYICLIDKTGVHYFLGRLDGSIALENRGQNGFGYDSIFEVDGVTLAEMSESEKNAISHRRMALNKLNEYLRKNDADI
jgi:XTP/dITP diphosphohydrolase